MERKEGLLHRAGRELTIIGSAFMIRAILRVHSGWRADFMSRIVGSVARNGYFADPLAFDEMELLPRGSKREVFDQINRVLILQRKGGQNG